MSYPKYAANAVVVTKRRNNGSVVVSPKSPCGISIPPGFILVEDRDQVFFVRETDYLSNHSLKYYTRRVQ